MGKDIELHSIAMIWVYRDVEGNRSTNNNSHNPENQYNVPIGTYRDQYVVNKLVT
jgi:hypothetical protein